MNKGSSLSVKFLEKNVFLKLFRTPRGQAALSGLAFFGIVVAGGLRWVASLSGNGPWQFLAGITTGFMAVLTFYIAQRFRRRSRFRRAVASMLMATLTLEDLRRLVPEYALDLVSFTNFEKIEWLNKELVEVWPFINKPMSHLLKDKLQLILDDYKMGFIEKLSVKSIVLGEESPQFGGVRVSKDNDNEVVLEAMFRWQCEKEEVLITVKTNGPDFILRINDVHISGVLKLVFKPLKEELPGFGAIIVSLSEDNTIRTAVLDVLVWPNRYVYPVLPGDYSNLELTPVGVLDASLIEATNLMNTDVLGKSDPFALLFVRLKTERIKRSSTKKNSLHPVWNEGFFIEVDDPLSQYLTIRLMDDETLANAEFIGMAKYPLKELKPHEPKELWLDLTYNPDTPTPEKSRGKVHLLLIYKPYEEDHKQGGYNENHFDNSEDDKKDV
ncbi:synaptotagmin-5 isoform X2 [Cryptomeria japonica]|uniref:synaptotagmin-5 isoform X2 n=1 Tax=Cryptomeria japonica TaxID=3369 RepID=UPI0025AC78CF|nr:synaptotagmin-5 isoform X2 [Cryptomeria japonica]